MHCIKRDIRSSKCDRLKKKNKRLSTSSMNERIYGTIGDVLFVFRVYVSVSKSLSFAIFTNAWIASSYDILSIIKADVTSS